MKENKKNVKVPTHGPHRGVGDKAKDFKGSITRLFKELKSFKVAIFIALILAALGSVLSIMTPNRSSDMVDEIAKGLVVNTKNMKKLTKEISNNFSEDKIGTRMQEILSMNIGPDTMNQVLMNPNISLEEKSKFSLFMQELSTSKDAFVKIKDFSSNIQEIILPTTVYKDVKITTKDKITLIDGMSSNNISGYSDSLKKVLFDDINIDGTVITSTDQIEFLSLFDKIDKKTDPEVLYKKIDKAPKSIKKVIKPKMNYKKSNWWKRTATESIKDQITIRTANTMKKILELCNK